MTEAFVILPVRVNPTMTAACIASLRAQDIPVTIMGIDNGTTDGCGPLLRAECDITVAYTKPKGLSNVWNRALHFAFDEHRLSHVICVNNDTMLRPDTCRLLIADGGPFVTGVGVGRMEQMNFPLGGAPRRPNPDFSCFLMRREAWETVGQFDEAMVTWAGDNDMHVRLHRAGIPAYCIDLPFYHIASGTLKHVDPETHEQLCRQSDLDREAFKAKYGCLPGSPAYSELFQ